MYLLLWTTRFRAFQNALPHDGNAEVCSSFEMVSVDDKLTIKIIKSLVPLPVLPSTMGVSLPSEPLSLLIFNVLFMILQFEQIATEKENVHLYPMYYFQDSFRWLRIFVKNLKESIVHPFVFLRTLTQRELCR